MEHKPLPEVTHDDITFFVVFPFVDTIAATRPPRWKRCRPRVHEHSHLLTLLWSPSDALLHRTDSQEKDGPEKDPSKKAPPNRACKDRPKHQKQILAL